MITEKWDLRFLSLAKEIASWSKDPNTRVGSVIVDQDKKIVSMGFNGLPQGIEDSDEVLNNRELKLSCILHAEENALIMAGFRAKGCSIYTWPFPPCSHCSSLLIQSKISRVVCPDHIPERWFSNMKFGQENMLKAGIELKFYNMSTGV